VVSPEVLKGDGQIVRTEDQLRESTMHLPPVSPEAEIICEADVTKDDIQVLTAKHDVLNRPDIAGEAARVATGIMSNSTEMREWRFEFAVTVLIWFVFFGLTWILLEAYAKMTAQLKENPQYNEHLTLDTMLPWWGNDAEYEAQVKRIFVEEFRKARSSAQRHKNFQEGASREALPQHEKERLDVDVFNVTTDRLRKMKANADAIQGKQ